MKTYKSDVIDLQPELYILCYGLNDMRAGMAVSDFEAEVASILSHVKEAGAPVIVLTTVYYMTGWKSYPPFDKGSVELTLEYNAAIRDLAKKHDCILADIWSAEEGADWLVHPDGVYANNVGNLVIAHKIFEALARHGSCLTNQSFEQGADTKWTQGTTAQRASDGDPFVKTW